MMDVAPIARLRRVLVQTLVALLALVLAGCATTRVQLTEGRLTVILHDSCAPAVVRR